MSVLNRRECDVKLVRNSTESHGHGKVDIDPGSPHECAKGLDVYVLFEMDDVHCTANAIQLHAFGRSSHYCLERTTCKIGANCLGPRTIRCPGESITMKSSADIADTADAGGGASV